MPDARTRTIHVTWPARRARRHLLLPDRRGALLGRPAHDMCAVRDGLRGRALLNETKPLMHCITEHPRRGTALSLDGHVSICTPL